QLPAWDEILELSHNPELERLSLLEQQGDWEGWMHRLVGCLVWLNETDSRHQAWSMWRSYLTKLYGDELPFELDLPVPFTSVEEAVALENFSTPLFAAYAGLNFFFLSAISFLIYGLTKVTFFESVRSSDELLTFWKFWGALFFILGVFVNGLNAPSPEAIENKWKKLRRRFSNEKNHPGRFFQLASR